MADLSFDRAIAFAADLIRIPSPPGGEGDAAERLRRELEMLGYDEVWSDDVGNVLGVVKGRGHAPAVMLSCHLDVVHEGDPAEWEHGPYSGDIADGFLHGRGAMDIKGPMALQAYAGARFLEDRPEGDVIIGQVVLEERGGWGMEHLLRAGEVKPAAVIIGEATNLDVTIGHRGRAELAIDIHGVAGHASAPDRAHNALDLLPAVLGALQSFADQLPSDPVLGKSSAVATGIDILPTSPNVIPDLARVIVDWRVLPDMTVDSTTADLGGWIGEHVDVPEGWRVDVHFVHETQHTYTGLEQDRALFAPGFLLAPDHTVARAAAEAVEAGLGRAPAMRPWTFATDGGHTCGVHGIPTVGFAPGEERHAHTNRERLALEPARAAYEIYPDMVKRIMAALG